MKVLCIANDIPLPANSGGRVDVWRRLCALQAAGHSLALLCWTDAGRVAPPSPDVIAQLERVCASVCVLPITRRPTALVRRLLQLWRWPSHAASRAIAANGKGVEAWAQAFAPDVVLLDGLYGGAVALRVSQQLKRPLWYRSHNIEHQYMAAQRTRESRFVRRLGLLANCLGLERFERGIMSRAERVLDISQDDAKFWRNEGVRNVAWLPTLVDHAFASRLASAADPPRFDVLYFGNLHTPNNVEAVTWLVHEVLSQIDNPSLRVAVAGSRPADLLREVLRHDKRITLIQNPEDMAAIVAQARVLVNPMLAGSGVNLKSVEMLFSGAALVSTSVGVGGLPAEAKACFAVADTPELFAAAVMRGLAANPDVNARHSVRMAFSPDAIATCFGRGALPVAASC